ncbi:MAG TPA: Rieske (2Fe-2S) protein, partial [Candidatus Methylomirabilis sp.]|nr:Rieske (2Fe-2S) protein [Candidatus Methylomirabilis sp.]
MSTLDPHRHWPGQTLARVPYWVYQDEDNYRAELRRIFEGPVWNYACLESDLERPGDYRTT